MSARASRLAACRVYRCQLMAVPFAVRYPANVRSCKQVGRLPGVSLPAHGSALRCPLPGKCPLVQARRPLAGCIAQKNRQPESDCLSYSNGSLRRRTSNMPPILFFFRNQMIRQSHKYNGAYHVSYSCQKYIVYILANPYVSVY